MIEETKKLDRRQQRTRILLRDALIELIVERGYDAVNLQDIAERANIARTTFYLHYKDKEQLLIESMKDVYAELDKKVDLEACLLYLADGISPSVVSYEHVAEYKAFYKEILGRKGAAAFVADIRDYLIRLDERMFEALLPPEATPRMPLSMVASYVTGAEIGLITWWVQNDLPCTAEELARHHYSLVVHGIAHAMGVDEDWLQG